MRAQSRLATAALAAALVLPSGVSADASPWTGQLMEPLTGGYAPVNGLELFYEIYGEGEPLILLHGGLGLGAMFQPVLPLLVEGRQVITVDLQGHGHTADVDRPLSYAAMADDVALLIRHLGLERADILGYSMGGGVALRTAIQHPEVVRRLVVVSMGFSLDAFYPEIVASIRGLSAAAAESMRGTPMYEAYAATAPRPEDFPRLLDKMGAFIGQDYDWSAEIPSIAAPVLLVYGDHDMFKPEHMVAFFKLLGGGQGDAGWDGAGMGQNRLAILPGLTHYTMLDPALAATVDAFLDQPAP